MKGLSLIELLISIVLLSVLLIVFTSAFVNGIKVYKRETRTSNLQNESRIVLDRIISDIKQASGVNTTSTATMLNLEVPSIDINENILYEGTGDFKIDNYIYTLNSNTITKTVDPHMDSSRPNSTKTILDKVSNVTFTYLPDLASAEEVEVTLVTDDSYAEEVIIVNNSSRAKLRNK